MSMMASSVLHMNIISMPPDDANASFEDSKKPSRLRTVE